MIERSSTRDSKVVLDRVMERVRSALEELPPQYLGTFAQELERVTEEADSLSPPSPPTKDLVTLLGGREYTVDERVRLEALSLLEEFRSRRALLQGALTAPQVGEILGSTRQMPHDRVRAGTLLAVMDRGALRFPAWQFDPEGENGTVPGLARVVKNLRLSPLGKVAWFTRPSPYLDGQTPLAALKAGQVHKVEELARGTGRT